MIIDGCYKTVLDGTAVTSILLKIIITHMTDTGKWTPTQTTDLHGSNSLRACQEMIEAPE